MERADSFWVPNSKEVVSEWSLMVKRSIRLEAYFKSWKYSYDFEGARPLVVSDGQYTWFPVEPDPVFVESVASTDNTLGSNAPIPDIPGFKVYKQCYT